jgi:hypothetical protein
MAGQLMRLGTNGNRAHDEQLPACRDVIAKHPFERSLIPGIRANSGHSDYSR